MVGHLDMVGTEANANDNIQSGDPHDNDRGSNDLVPHSFMFVQSVQKHVAGRPLTVLFDPGSKGSFINKRAILAGANPQITHNAGTMQTVAGTFANNLTVVLRDLVFQEFSNSLVVERHGFYAFDQPNIR